MKVVYLLLLAVSAICFLASAYGAPDRRIIRPVNLISLGLFFWVLVPLIETARALANS